MVINLNLDDTIKINQTRVIFMPYYRLLDENIPGAGDRWGVGHEKNMTNDK
jgi:hypothetical protein